MANWYLYRLIIFFFKLVMKNTVIIINKYYIRREKGGHSVNSRSYMIYKLIDICYTIFIHDLLGPLWWKWVKSYSSRRLRQSLFYKVLSIVKMMSAVYLYVLFLRSPRNVDKKHNSLNNIVRYWRCFDLIRVKSPTKIWYFWGWRIN